MTTKFDNDDALFEALKDSNLVFEAFGPDAVDSAYQWQLRLVASFIHTREMEKKHGSESHEYICSAAALGHYLINNAAKYIESIVVDEEKQVLQSGREFDSDGVEI